MALGIIVGLTCGAWTCFVHMDGKRQGFREAMKARWGRFNDPC